MFCMDLHELNCNIYSILGITYTKMEMHISLNSNLLECQVNSLKTLQSFTSWKTILNFEEVNIILHSWASSCVEIMWLLCRFKSDNLIILFKISFNDCLIILENKTCDYVITLTPLWADTFVYFFVCLSIILWHSLIFCFHFIRHKMFCFFFPWDWNTLLFH